MTSMAQTALPRASGNDRDFIHAYHILNPFRYVRTRTKRELMDKLEWVLRLSTAICLIGHGFWGTISKPSWVDLITPMGFSEPVAWALVPWIGWGDIVLGLLILMRPRPILLWKAFLWTLFTPFLRPLAGLSWFEVPERAGNFGAPLAFLVLAGGMGLMRTWWNGFEVVEEPESKLTERTVQRIRVVLQLSLALLLIGHGGLVAVTQKAMYFDHLRAIGIQPSSALLVAIGWFEILLGVAIAARPWIPLIWFAFFWKLFTESLYPFAGSPVDVFEWIERWGDYGIPIALILILRRSRGEAEGTPSQRAVRRESDTRSVPSTSDALAQ
jgi:uncharacterized membrane protein YphA (DoxX/SURF4 family)